MTTEETVYPARFEIEYPEQLDRLTTFFRLIWIIPIAALLSILSATANSSVTIITDTGDVISKVYQSSGGIVGALFLATLLMLLFRKKYPRWWFDFALEFNRFATRVGAYTVLLTDKYPSTDEEQAVHLDLEYPDAQQLNRGLPLVKWFLAIPHYIALTFLVIGAVFAMVIAWFAIMFTGRYPRGLFDYVVGVGRWGWRVAAYAYLLATDEYPPFSLS